MSFYSVFDSPVGELLALGDGESLEGLWFVRVGGDRLESAARTGAPRDDAAFAEVRTQLSEYFAGERRTFELPLGLVGSEWERRVWEALLAIPYGETRSYGSIARALGEPGAARAVGLANGRNPIAVIVPCHRVIGSDGSLIGYGGGLERKRYLLDLERGTLPLSA